MVWIMQPNSKARFNAGYAMPRILQPGRIITALTDQYPYRPALSHYCFDRTISLQTSIIPLLLWQTNIPTDQLYPITALTEQYPYRPALSHDCSDRTISLQTSVIPWLLWQNNIPTDQRYPITALTEQYPYRPALSLQPQEENSDRLVFMSIHPKRAMGLS